ncbi:hypothetical protein ACNHUS_35305 [Actinomycetes bacterium M1A6_2h]
MTQMLYTTTSSTFVPMHPAVITVLTAITGRFPEIDAPMFRLDGDRIAFEGHDTGRMVLIDVPGDGLYARYDRRRHIRATATTPATAIWEPTAEWPVTLCDPVGIARTIWRLAVEDAT